MSNSFRVTARALWLPRSASFAALSTRAASAMISALGTSGTSAPPGPAIMTVIAGREQRRAGCRLGGVVEGPDLGVGLGDGTEGQASCRPPRVKVDATFAVGGSDSLRVRPGPDIHSNDAASAPHRPRVVA